MDQNVWKTMFLSPRPAWSFSMRSLDNGTVEQFMFANKKCASMCTCFSPVHILRRSCHEHVLWCCCNFGNYGVKPNNSVGVPRRGFLLIMNHGGAGKWATAGEFVSAHLFSVAETNFSTQRSNDSFITSWLSAILENLVFPMSPFALNAPASAHHFRPPK